MPFYLTNHTGHTDENRANVINGKNAATSVSEIPLNIRSVALKPVKKSSRKGKRKAKLKLKLRLVLLGDVAAIPFPCQSMPLNAIPVVVTHVWILC